MTAPVYVIARSLKEARLLVPQVSPLSIRLLDAPEKLRGLDRGTVVYVSQVLFASPNDLIREAILRNLTVQVL